MRNHPKTPKYWKLAESLREQIENGALAPGMRLPSVAQAQAQHGVSLSTVNQAHALLEKDGLIVREQGRGTFVAEQGEPARTRRLGLVMHVDSTTDLYVSELLAGVREEVVRQELELLWLSDEDVKVREQADALLFYCDPTEVLAMKIPARLPHVLLFQHSAEFNCVAFDDYGGAKLAVRHLLDLGHQRIACLQDNDYDSVSRQRLAGYRDALTEAEIETDKSWVRFLNDNQERLGSYHASAEVTMMEWIENGWHETGCTALVAHNDSTAIGAIKALRAHGLHVPRDVSVVGFDGTELSQLSTPSLTTIKVPLREIGAVAVRQLLAKRSVKTTVKNNREPQTIVLPVQLQIGKSSAPIKHESEAELSLTNKKE